MATQLGKAVSFGFSGTDGIAATEFTGKILLQNAEHSKASEEERVRDSEGATVNRSFYDPSDKATLEYIVTGANIAGARTNTALPDPGDIISITACADIPALVKTNWVVVGEPKLSGSNTSAKRVSLSLEAHANITAAAS